MKPMTRPCTDCLKNDVPADEAVMDMIFQCTDNPDMPGYKCRNCGAEMEVVISYEDL